MLNLISYIKVTEKSNILFTFLHYEFNNCFINVANASYNKLPLNNTKPTGNLEQFVQ